MQAQFRDLWRRAVSPVTVITTSFNKQLAGMTISSLTSVSMGPPHVLVSFNCQVPSRTAEILEQRGKLVLNTLPATPSGVLVAKALAGRVAGGHSINPFDKYPDLFHANDETCGIPRVKDASSWLLCSTQHVFDAQDHKIVVARVDKMHIGDLDPLIYRDHRFWGIGQEIKQK